MRRLRPQLWLIVVVLALLSAIAPALLVPPPPVQFGANVPAVGRYSKEADWANAGGLVSWGLQGRTARISSLAWNAYPEGFNGKQVDHSQALRQMEVVRPCKRVIVLLAPSDFPTNATKDWIPVRESWPAAADATLKMVASYDAAAKRLGMPLPDYQIWNETSPNKPGGAKSGPPGEFYPLLHEYLAFLMKRLVPTTTSPMKRRIISPAWSDLTDSADAALGSLASGISKDSYAENRYGAIAIHIRIKGTMNGRGMTPAELEAAAPVQADRLVQLVRSLAPFRGKDLPVDATEIYLTPGDIGRPDLSQTDLDPWRQALLRGLAKSKLRSAIFWGLPTIQTEPGGKWGEYGGWASSLSRSKIEEFASTVPR